MLSRDEGIRLVRKTRQGVESHLEGLTHFDPGPRDTSELWKKHGVFVTVKESQNHMVRGCIGNPLPRSPLVVEAIQSGILAATRDPRFHPVALDEMHSEICLEATILSTLEEILEEEPARIVETIQVGRDGLMVDGFGHRGLLLPQVAVEEQFNPELFLTHCCLKAGLPPDMWLDPAVKIFRFGGQIFSEKSPNVDAGEVVFPTQ